MSGNIARRREGPGFRRCPTARWNGWASNRCRPCARHWKNISLSATGWLPDLRLDRIVAFARLRPKLFVCQPDLQMPVGAVLHRVAGGVADRILAAHFILKLAEDL